MPFPYRTALITGASAGFGAEFARRLAPQVDRLILLARRVERLEELRAKLARPGLQIDCEVVDLADEASLERFLASPSLAAVDLLMNNAGLGDHGFFDEGTWERVGPMLNVNIRALTRLTHAVLPGMVRAGRGAILNVSSVAAFLPVPNMAVYAATKAYVTSFSESLRAELRTTGVRVTTVCPGPVETEFFQRAERGGAPGISNSPDFLKVTPGEVVRTALVGLCTDRASVIPGLQVWAVMGLIGLIPMFLLRLILRQRR